MYFKKWLLFLSPFRSMKGSFSVFAVKTSQGPGGRSHSIVPTTNPCPWPGPLELFTLALPTPSPQQFLIFQVFPPWHQSWLQFPLLGVHSGKPRLPIFPCLFSLEQPLALYFPLLRFQEDPLVVRLCSFLLVRVMNSKLLICEIRLVLHFSIVRYKVCVIPLVVL